MVLARTRQSSSLSSDIQSVPDLLNIADRVQWASLAHCALEPNVFYAPAFLAASQQHIERTVIRAVICRDEAGALLGFLPYRPATIAESWGLPALKCYSNPYVQSSMPLLNPDHATEALGSLIARLSAAERFRPLLLLPHVDLEGDGFAALAAACDTLGRSFSILRETKRAFFTQNTHPAEALQKKLGKSVARLAKLGRVDLSIGVRDTAHGKLVEAFLKLEAMGWKGAAGTALLSKPTTAAFARSAFGPANLDMRFDVLRLDGRPIAINLNPQSQNRVYTLKTAYDESFRSHSPGKTLDMAMALEAGRTQTHSIDSCALPGHHLEQFWPGLRRFGYVAIDITPDASPSAFRLASNMMKQVLHWREKAKEGYRALRKGG
jgi:CelD/BcsL family acetyltransferase involved in cellulose biosynthesis